MRKLFLGFLLVLCGCFGIKVPESFTYQEIQTKTYKLASWQKITDPSKPVRIYIEGDGNSFNYAGYPTSDPTPKGTFLRKIAFNDPNPNVVYLARPCQYVQDPICSEIDWTTGRFSQKVVNATSEAIQKVLKGRSTVLVGYSGGALLSGLVISQNPKIKVVEWKTLAGVLNHTLWTKDLNVFPLSDSIELESLPKVPQRHYVGKKDTTVSFRVLERLVPSGDLVVIPDATHDSGFERYYSEIYASLR